MPEVLDRAIATTGFPAFIAAKLSGSDLAEFERDMPAADDPARRDYLADWYFTTVALNSEDWRRQAAAYDDSTNEHGSFQEFVAWLGD